MSSIVPSISSQSPYVTKEADCIVRRHTTAQFSPRASPVLGGCTPGRETPASRIKRVLQRADSLTWQPDDWRGEKTTMMCRWQPVKWKGRGTLLGYYVTLEKKTQENVSDQLKMFPFRPIAEEDERPRDVPQEEGKPKFFFCYEANSFYQDYHSQSSRIPGPEISISPQRFGTPLAGRFLKSKKSEVAPALSPFYVNLLPVLRSIAELTKDPSMLALVMSKKYYGEDVETYRLIRNGIIKTKDECENMLAAEDWSEKEAKRRKNIGNGENIDALRATLKNKECLERTLRAFPVPQSFFWLIIVCGMAICLSVTCCAVEFVVYRGLYLSLFEEFGSIYYMPELYVDVSEPSRYLMQAVAVNSYIPSPSLTRIEDFRTLPTHTRRSTAQRSLCPQPGHSCRNVSAD